MMQLQQSPISGMYFFQTAVEMAMPHAVTTGPCLMRSYKFSILAMDFSGLTTQIILPPFFVLTSGEKQMIRVTNSIK